MRDISSAVTAVKSNNLVHGLFAITGGGASAVDRRMLCLCSKELGEVVADSSAVFSINDVDSGVFGNTPCFDQRAFESWAMTAIVSVNVSVSVRRSVDGDDSQLHCDEHDPPARLTSDSSRRLKALETLYGWPAERSYNVSERLFIFVLINHIKSFLFHKKVFSPSVLLRFWWTLWIIRQETSELMAILNILMDCVFAYF